MKILIKNGNIINPATKMNQISDMLISDGKVLEIGENISVDVDEIINAQGKLVVPGFVDLHVHLREPGFEYKETIESGTKAAVAGGVTTLACMPNTSPAIHSKSVIETIQEKTKQAKNCKVEVVGAITKDIIGKEIAPIDDLIEAGAVGLSDDGRTTPDLDIMIDAFKIAKQYDIPLMVHTEDEELARGGCMNEGEVSKRLGLQGIPNAAESNIVKRDIEMCEQTDSRLHICHVSAKESMEHIIEAKKKDLNVTVEICPHHFILTDEIVKAEDAYSKVNPPIRTQNDVDFMLSCIKEGCIDAIVTDHAPHDEDSKKVHYSNAAFGISGLETSFALSYTYLVKANLITIDNLIELMSYNPAKIIRKDIGDISVGKTADIAIIDPEYSYKINSAEFYSKGKNTPFNGYEVYGAVDFTIVDGVLVYRRAI